MKNHIKSFLSVAALILAGGQAYAQFTLGAEIRPRTEYRHGYKGLSSANQDAAFFTDQRTRLDFGYKTDGMRVFVQVQDIRTWGSQSQLNATDGLLSLHQAWGEFDLNSKTSLRLGRQEWVYNTHRILGNVGWAQQARSHDGALLKFKASDSFVVHLGAAFNQNGPHNVGILYTVPKNYKSMVFLWAQKSFSEQFKASFLFLNNGTQPMAFDSLGNVSDWQDKYSQIIGTHLEYKKDKLSGTAWFYYQMGNDNVLGSKDIQAMDAAFELAFKSSKKTTIKAGFEYLSGNSQVDTTASYASANHAFAPLYGTNHKFNGFMDYFYVGNHAKNVGLIDPYVKFVFKQKKTSFGLDVHFFQAAADVLDAQYLTDSGERRAMNASLGTELDLSMATSVNDHVKIKVGYSQLFATDTMVALKGGNASETHNWAYVMVIMKPKFIQ